MNPVESNYPRDIVTRYYSKVFATWWCCFPMMAGASTLIAIAERGVGFTTDTWETIRQWFGITATCLVSLFPALAVICRMFPLTLSNQGIRTFIGFGAYAQLGWDDISSMPPLNILGLRYFRISKRGLMFAALIPFDLDNRELFFGEVVSRLGAEHPFVVQVAAAWRMSGGQGSKA